MNGIKTAAINELLKITAHKKYKLIIILSSLCIVGVAVMSWIPGSAWRFYMSNFPYTVLSAITLILMPIVAFLLAYDLLASEMESQLIKVSLTQPLSRAEIFMGKFAAMVIYVSCLVFLLTLLSSFLAILSGSFGFYNLGTLFFILLITILPASMICSLALLTACYMQTAVIGLLANLVIYAGLIILGYYTTSLYLLLPTSYMSIYKLLLNQQVLWSNLLIGLTVLTSYTLIFASAANMKFEELEVL